MMRDVRSAHVYGLFTINEIQGTCSPTAPQLTGTGYRNVTYVMLF